MGDQGDRIIFADPLYELGVFRQGSNEPLIARLDPNSRKRSELYRRILDTYEVSRLAFLRQSGLGFLVFPSSSHTRLAHALGTWALGQFAQDQIRVQHKKRMEAVHPSKPQTTITLEPLRAWMNYPSRNYEEEFALALLLHDIGHPPFSHVIESNPDLHVDHERHTRDLIAGEGEIYQQALQNAKALGVMTVNEVLREYAAEVAGSNAQWTIRAKFQDVVDILTPKTDARPNPDFMPLKELVDGTTDLDRIDHYNRDSYFMGVKLANTNIKGLLENVVIEFDDTLTPPKTTVTVLEEGEPHLLQLLFSKDLLWRTALDHDVVRSYEAMLNRAIAVAVEEGLLSMKSVWLMTDDELLLALERLQPSRPLVMRLRARRPFATAFRRRMNGTRAQIEGAVERVRTRLNVGPQQLLLHFATGFGKPKTEDDWLNLFVRSERGVLARPVSLASNMTSNENDRSGRTGVQARNPELFRFFGEQDQHRRALVRVFCEDDNLAQRARALLDDALEALVL